MFNFGNNQWWINQLAQRTKTKNLLPKLHREKIDEEGNFSVEMQISKYIHKRQQIELFLYYSHICILNHLSLFDTIIFLKNLVNLIIMVDMRHKCCYVKNAVIKLSHIT